MINIYYKYIIYYIINMYYKYLIYYIIHKYYIYINLFKIPCINIKFLVPLADI